MQGEFKPFGSWHDYVLTNVYDHKNRRVFKSFVDENSNVEAQWFFYYDLEDRLIEIKHTPDISSSSTYSFYQHYWIGQRPVAYWQIDYPSATTTKRYIHSDDINRPLEVYSWSDTASRVWAINPYLFAWDTIVVGSSVFQPLRFPGQYWDEETIAYDDNHNQPSRPGLHYNRFRTYNPYTGTYLQVDPLVDSTWEAYNYVSQNPAMWIDPTGLILMSPDNDGEHTLDCSKWSGNTGPYDPTGDDEDARNLDGVTQE